MTEKLTVSGSLLAADTEARTLKGLLLPFGEQGRTNRGQVTAAEGTVAIPADVSSIVLNLGHDRDRPAGRATSIVETAKGLVAEFAIARVPAGDQLLAEAAEGLRKGLSVELDDIAIRAGRLIAAKLTDVGAVVRPAFPSALVAEDAGDVPPELQADYDSSSTSTETYTDPDTGEEVTVTTTRRESSKTETTRTDAEGNTSSGTNENEEPTVTASAAAPADLKAAAATRGGSLKAADVHPEDAYRLIAEAFGSGNAQLTAALADVTVGTPANGVFGRVNQATWLGELWSGRAYQRKYVPLMNPGTVTGMKVQGYRWVTKPQVGDYAGDKAAVPTNTVAVEPVEATTKRIAGAWDVDRAYWDLGSTEFLRSFFAAMTESYARLSDQRALDTLLAAATANPTTPGTVPTDVSPAMAAIVDGALALLDTALPSYALVASDLYRDVLLTRSDDTLAYLNAALGLEDGTIGNFRILPGSGLPDGQVVVGARQAVTFYELGETPIRVEAENIERGGRDVGVFGYWAAITNEASAITLVDTAPDVAP